MGGGTNTTGLINPNCRLPKGGQIFPLPFVADQLASQEITEKRPIGQDG